MKKFATIAATLLATLAVASCGASDPLAGLPEKDRTFVTEMIEVDEGFGTMEPEDLVKMGVDFCRLLDSTTSPGTAMRILYETLDESTAMLAAVTMVAEHCPGQAGAIARYTGLKY